MPHEKPQRWLALHDTVAFVIGAQSASTQQPEAGMQTGPQRLKPPTQVKSHDVPLQRGAPLAGSGQGSQPAPQELMLALARHWPLQSCVPAGHWFRHFWEVEMQAPAHSCSLSGHRPPQVWPSHVAVPPVGAAHVEQDVPQWAGIMLSTHWPLHG
jgi:hypothetical protein